MKKGFLPLSFLLVITILSGLNSYASGSDKNKTNGPAETAETYLNSIRANQHTGLIDPIDLLKASLQVDQMTQGKGKETLNWVNLGPDNFAGQVKAILFDNRDASGNTVLAGTSGGGIWRSTNDGITWHKVSNINMLVSTMVQAANGDIYVGTGDGYSAQSTNGLNDYSYTTGMIGKGVFKSSDGETFTQIASTMPSMNSNTAEWAFVNGLAISPSGDILAATNTGLMYSNDGGTSWSVAIDAEGNELNMNATDVKVGSDGLVIAAVDKKCYVSKTGNYTAFVNRSTADSVSLPTANVDRLVVAVAPSDPNRLYVSCVRSTGIQEGIYTSADQGDHWTLILPASTSINVYAGRGSYNNHLTVFPNDPTRILIGGADIWQGRMVQETGFYAWDQKSRGITGIFDPSYVHLGQQCIAFKPGTDDKFYAGSDGGTYKGSISGDAFSFEPSNRNLITSRFYKVAPSGGENRLIGGAQDHGSLYISGNGNTNKQAEVIYPNNFSSFTDHGGSCAFSTIFPDAAVLSTTAGSMVRTEDLGFTYSSQFLGSLMTNAAAFNTPIALWESYNDQNSRDSITFTARRNYTAGEVIKPKSSNNDHPFYHTLTQNLSTGDTLRIKDIVASKLFIAVANRLWMTKQSLNFEVTPEWFQLANTTVGFSGTPVSIAFSNDANHVFVGMKNGKLYRVSNIALAYDFATADVTSEDQIVTTTELEVYLPGTSTQITQAITSIAVDQKNPNNVLITVGNYGNDVFVYMTTNALAETPEFTSKQGNLPKMPVYSSLLEMTNPEKAMIGTEHGIFITDNVLAANPVWTADQAEMGDVPVFDLKQQVINKAADTVQLINIDTLVLNYPGTNNFGIVYAASFGRGLYRCNNFRKPVGLDENPLQADVDQLQLSIFPNPVINQAYASFEVKDQNSSISYIIYDLSGRTVQNKELGQFAAGNHQISIETKKLQTGAYILRMTDGKRSSSSKFLVY